MIQRAATDGSSWGLKEKLLTEMLWNQSALPLDQSFPLLFARLLLAAGLSGSFLPQECQLHHHCILAHLAL
jgi:hypothetical protein